jgi:cell division protein FtsL
MSANNQKKKPIFKKINTKIAVAVLLMVVVFFGSQIYITSVIGTSNAAIEEIRKEKDELRLTNEILSSQIDELKSIKNISEVAEKYGLSEKQIELITSPDSNIAIDL